MTIQTPPEFRQQLFELGGAAFTLASMAVLFESPLAAALVEPRTLDELAALCPALSPGRIERCLQVAASRGMVVAEGGRWALSPGARPAARSPERESLAGELRANLMLAMALVESATDGRGHEGWTHRNPALLRAMGQSSAGFAPAFQCFILPSLGDLAERLGRPGARFLDVGAGVGALTIAMCGLFPALRAVAIDPFEPSVALAREAVSSAGLGERIEVRGQAVEQLEDEAAFDLVWMPSFFIPAAALPTAAARLRAALRPGGWVLFPVLGAGSDTPQQAVSGLLNDLWGGARLSTDDARRLLEAQGLSVQMVPGPPWAPSLVAARRPETAAS